MFRLHATYLRQHSEMFQKMLPKDFTLNFLPISDDRAFRDVHGQVAPGQPLEITIEQMELGIRMMYAE